LLGVRPERSRHRLIDVIIFILVIACVTWSMEISLAVVDIAGMFYTVPFEQQELVGLGS